ncbi:MAG: hypothetical protein ACP5QO_01845 [Clostridia bacterium]
MKSPRPSSYRTVLRRRPFLLGSGASAAAGLGGHIYDVALMWFT